MNNSEYIITEKDAGKRVDKFLAGVSQNLSRSYLQKLIDDGEVLLNGEEIKSSYNLKEGDRVSLTVPEAEEMDIEPLAIEIDILFEDNDILVVNKQPGLVVHPAPGNRRNTLVNALIAYTDDLSGINGVKRQGIVHRLDKDTSGALVIAKNDRSHRHLVKQFKNRETKKIYRTIVKGNLKYDKGKIDAPIGRNPDHRKKMAVTRRNSKKAVTRFNVLERLNGFTYLEITLETGRTHQIRVHFSYIGHPVLGDEKYSGDKQPIARRQMLHAYRLGLFHPRTGEWLEFTAPLPVDFVSVLDYLKEESCR